MKKPIELHFISASDKNKSLSIINTFTSYSFDRSVLTPASAFRFTAPGVDKEIRISIRSGDTVYLFGIKENSDKVQIATGFLDETDTHITPSSVEYVLTGRDTLGQLVDSDTIDDDNVIINTKQAKLKTIVEILLRSTRIPKGIIEQQIPNGSFLFQTNPQETKANAIQRYLEFTNCLIWSAPDGRAIVGKPRFNQQSSGKLILRIKSQVNNCLEARVRRNINQVIRKIVTLVQGTEKVKTTPYTLKNSDVDLQGSPGVGRSIFRMFSYGSGNDVVNLITGIGNSSPWQIGNQMSQREIAKDNMKVLDVEIVVEGHLNSNGELFNVDQIYDVDIEDDNVAERMYVYHCSYELTIQHGMITRLHLCRENTICATSAVI